MKKETLNITGMTCAACANAVERSVRKLEGVESASVNLAVETLTVEYDETAVDIKDVKDAVIREGYGVEEPKTSNVKEILLPIEGMTCAACSTAVERALKKLPGVEEAVVNYATDSAKITYDLTKTRFSDIKEAVAKAGYKALDLEVNAPDVTDRRQNEIQALWRRFMVAVVFTVPLFYISMGHMVGLPLPSFLDPGVSPLNFALAQLLLTVPVMIAGYRFYTVGFSKLFRLEPNMDSLIAIGTGAAFLYGVYAVLQIIKVTDTLLWISTLRAWGSLLPSLCWASILSR